MKHNINGGLDISEAGAGMGHLFNCTIKRWVIMLFVVSISFGDYKKVSAKVRAVSMCLRHIQYRIDYAAWICMGSDDGTPESFWWAIRVVFVDFVAAFGEEEVVPSL